MTATGGRYASDSPYDAGNGTVDIPIKLCKKRSVGDGVALISLSARLPTIGRSRKSLPGIQMALDTDPFRPG
jgi:hypothetical protein